MIPFSTFGNAHAILCQMEQERAAAKALFESASGAELLETVKQHVGSYVLPHCFLSKIRNRLGTLTLSVAAKFLIDDHHVGGFFFLIHHVCFLDVAISYIHV